MTFGYESYSFDEESLMGFIHEARKLGREYILRPADGSIDFLKKDHSYLFFFSSSKGGEDVVEAVKLNNQPPYAVMIKKDSVLIQMVNGTGPKKP